jgi:hypothetical protein
MSKTPRLYAYHPVSGDPLIGTLDMLTAVALCEISRIDGVTTIEEGTESIVDWNGQEVADLNGRQVLITEAGATCLIDEVLWCVHDVPKWNVTTKKPATNCPSYNQLMSAYILLHQTLTVTISNLKAGYTEGQMEALLSQVNSIFDVDRLCS